MIDFVVVVDVQVDALMGIGGTPEGVIAAAALKCLGGAIQGRLWPRHDEDRRAFEAAGLDTTRVLTTNDLCSGSEARSGPHLRMPPKQALAPLSSRRTCHPSFQPFVTAVRRSRSSQPFVTAST